MSAESAVGDGVPMAGVRWGWGAQVGVIAAGVIAMACGYLMWRNLGDTMWNPETGASYLPGWDDMHRELLTVAPAGAGVLVAVAGLALRGRARWLGYLEIGLWLLTLGSFVYLTEVFGPFTGLGLLYGPIGVAGVCGVVAVSVLAWGLRRPDEHRPPWQLAFVLLAAALPCIAATSGLRYAYGPGYGVAVGIVARCPAAGAKADVGWAPDPSRVVIVSAENQAGRIVASQRLPLRMSGARYRLRLLAGTYSVNVATESGDNSESDNWEFVPTGGADELDFNDPAEGECV